MNMFHHDGTDHDDDMEMVECSMNMAVSILQLLPSVFFNFIYR